MKLQEKEEHDEKDIGKLESAQRKKVVINSRLKDI